MSANVTSDRPLDTDLSSLQRRVAELEALVASRSDSQARSQALVESSRDWIWEMDLEGIHTYSNHAVQDILGYAPVDLVGKDSLAFMHPEDRERIAQRLPAWIAERRGWQHLLIRWRHKGGDWRYLESNAVPTFNGQGALTGFLGVDRDVTRRIQAEERLSASERFNRSIIDNSDDCIKLLDIDGRLTFISDKGLRRMRADSPDLFLGRRFDDLWEGRHQGVCRQALAEARNGRQGRFTGHLPARDGTPKWWDVVITPVLGESGHVESLLAVSRDITDRKQAEDTLHTLVESMVGLTGQAYFDKVTSELCRWFGAEGASIGELVEGHRIRAISMELDGSKVLGYQYILEGTPCDGVVRADACLYSQDVCRLFPEDRDLQELNIEGYAGAPIRDQNGRVLGIVWVISRKPLIVPPQWTDVLNIIAAKTGAEIERLRAETALKESVEKYRTLVETTQDFVWEVNQDNVFTYCSPQVREILGYEPDELLGRTPFDLMPAEETEQVYRRFREIRGRGMPFSSLQSVSLHKDGHEVVLDASGAPFFDAEGRLLGYRGIDRDISARKRAEDYLRESEKRFRELIEKLPNVAVQGYDRERRIIYWNDASARLYGYSAADAMGARLEDLIVPESMRAAVVEAVQGWYEHGREIPCGELELRRKDGTPVAVYSSHVMLKRDSPSPEMFCIDVDLTEQKRAQAELRRLATYDQLTQLPNRYLLNSDMAHRITEAQRFGQRLALLFIDLDNFKVINDSLGHDTGDALLRQVASRLSSLLRKYDTLARFGGDEFVLLMPRVQETSEVATVAEKIVRQFSQPFKLEGQEFFVTTSVGISVFPDDGKEVGELMKHADAAMYRAKDAGRNRYRFFTQAINDELRRHQQIAGRLRTALTNREFTLHYQPQVDLQSGAIRGCEALIRWLPPNGEPISPATFIPVAEKSDLINRIGEWVISEACRQKAEWRRKGYGDIRIDINLSGRQLAFNDIFPLLYTALGRHGLTPKDIGIELTENVLIQADKVILGGLRRLREEGMQIAIDDFGTGYSSLSYVKRFPVTALKIDQEFVRDAPRDKDDRSIMEAIVAVGHSLGLEVIVEGVEHSDQHLLVQQMHCDLAQGFFFYRPMQARSLERLLGRQSAVVAADSGLRKNPPPPDVR
jgi:diguanylate cyclase (GGDEF)-like protein/PAS domain S-box-containing protein